jgi:hypothetical protein
MSLLNTASPWTSEDSSKKRQPTMRKTFKLKPTDGEIKGADLNNKIEGPEDYISTSESYQNLDTTPPSIEKTQQTLNDRNNRVNDLLNKITSADDAENNKMGSFQPMPNPNITAKKEEKEDMSLNILKPPNLNRQKAGNFSANDTPVAIYSSYQNSYEAPPLFKKNTQHQHVAPVRDNKLMEKINYMIQLLEEQQHEKTANITEEFILYTFLGVFIIFVVDSFSRSGKYTR